MHAGTMAAIRLPASFYGKSKTSNSFNSKDTLLTVVSEVDVTLARVQDFIKQNEGAVDLDQRDRQGMTPLMMACTDGKFGIVEYLLKEGADVNLTTPGDGNTAFHFACMYTSKEVPSDKGTWSEEGEPFLITSYKLVRQKRSLRGIPNVPLPDKIVCEISLLLVRFKAKSVANRHGMYPLDYAALYRRSFTISLLSLKDCVAKLEIIRALETLGVMLACEEKYRNAMACFNMALVERKSDPHNLIETVAPSVLEDVLHQKEWHARVDSKAFLNKGDEVLAQAVLVGDRVLPDNLKPKFLYEPMAKYGFQVLHKKKTKKLAFRIFDACLDFEKKGVLYLNTVLMYIRMSVCQADVEKALQEPLFINGSCKTLAAYCDVVKVVGCHHLEKSVKDLMCNLGRILFDVVDKYRWLRTLEKFLTPICEMIRIIWERIPKPEATGTGILFPTVSVSHNVLLHMGREFNSFYCAGKWDHQTFFLFKRLIAHLLHVEGALDIDWCGNTMIHTLMVFSHTLPPGLIVDITKLLIRHGCPPNARNKQGKTPYDIAKEGLKDLDDDDDDDDDDDYEDMDDDDDDDDDEVLDENQAVKMEVLSDLLKGPKPMLSLQELAARSVLRHNIPYREQIPPSMFAIIQDPILKEDEEKYVYQRSLVTCPHVNPGGDEIEAFWQFLDSL